MKILSIASFLLLASALATGSAGAADTPRPVTVARATDIPKCTVFVDAASRSADGTAQKPHKTIAAAIDATDSGAVICVAQGVYAEQLAPGDKFFTLAGGFQSGSGFKARDSAKHVSKAKGSGKGSFLRIVDPGPVEGLTAIDGFEITGYSQAIVRDYYEPQRFDITNNYIHDNTCSDQSLAGAGFALNNVTGAIRGNVIKNNSCSQGGAGSLNDDSNKNTVSIESNLIDGNSGTEPSSAHGGGLYVGSNTLRITGNMIINNSVTQWGGGLYIGAYTQGNQPTTATLSWNVYRGNRAGDSGGGFFCDNGATCIASHEVYDRNCGGNILVDGGSEGSGPTKTKFDLITNVAALSPDCSAPGIGFWMDTYDAFAPDNHTISNAIFWGNADGQDLAATCGNRCKQLKLSVSNSLVQAKSREDGVKIVFGPNLIAASDPLFLAPEKGDFRLQPGSPAAGKATSGGDLGAYAIGDKPPLASSPASATVATKTAPVTDSAAIEPIQPSAELSPEATPTAGATSQRVAQQNDVSAKEAFDAAKELGTSKAWKAFLANYPDGFLAELARAYLDKLGVAEPTPAVATGGGVAASTPAKPAVVRGANFMGFAEKFNRYYTDPTWKPAQTLYVSPKGGGDGATREAPMAVNDAVAAARPGTLIYFLRGAYQAGVEFTKETSGAFDQPIVLYGERNDDKSLGVQISCVVGERKTCINFEGADYIAVDGFELIGGRFGVRVVGADFAASQHSRGIAVLNSIGHDQDRDPFFTGQSDWAVFEGNVAYGAKKGDGHGFYISNGSDWNIVRYNETYGNLSSDFQINADPNFTCKEVGIPFADPRCDAYAGEGEGGQGASDYFLFEGNYLHHGLAQGANFTSVRRSVVRNNIFGLHAEKHNVSFWQETDNPNLGSSENKILHNLFVTSSGRHGVKFENHSTRNEFANNVILGVKIAGGAVTANPKALLMEVDDTVGDNVYRGNFYSAGTFEGREPGAEETAGTDFSPAWFAKFPSVLNHDPNDFTPASGAPFLGLGALLPDASTDRNGGARTGKVDLGPIEVK